MPTFFLAVFEKPGITFRRIMEVAFRKFAYHGNKIKNSCSQAHDKAHVNITRKFGAITADAYLAHLIFVLQLLSPMIRLAKLLHLMIFVEIFVAVIKLQGLRYSVEKPLLKESVWVSYIMF